MSGRLMVWIGLCCVLIGIGLMMFLAPRLRAVSIYEISPIDPHPVVKPWVEGKITVDARSRQDWVYFDFSRGSVVTDAVIDGHNWDLAFMRYRVATNSGTSHPDGQAGAIKLGDRRPDSAPETGYDVDAWEGPVSYNPAFRRWYRYNPMANGLVSRGYHYVVRTADGGYARLRFLSYQCPQTLGGGHGCVTFQYGYRSDFSRELSAP